MRLPLFAEDPFIPETCPSGHRTRPPRWPPAPPGAPGEPPSGPGAQPPAASFPPDAWLDRVRLLWFTLHTLDTTRAGIAEHATLAQAHRLMEEATAINRKALAGDIRALRKRPGGRRDWPRVNLQQLQYVLVDLAIHGEPGDALNREIDGVLHRLHPTRGVRGMAPESGCVRYPLLPKHGPLLLRQLRPEAFLDRIFEDLVDTLQVEALFSDAETYRNQVLVKFVLLRRAARALTPQD